MFPMDIAEFSALFTKWNIVFYISFAVLNGLFLFYASLKFLLALQQSNYKFKRYYFWLISPSTPYLSRLMLLTLLGFLFFSVLNVCFAPALGNTVSSYVGFVSYLLFTSLYIKSESSVNVKVPLKKTKRLVRLAIVYCVVLAAATFGIMMLSEQIAFATKNEIVCILRYALICVLPILSPLLLSVANLILTPLEKIINYYYVKIATDKLNGSSTLKIGITGSYGKTSVKEILKTVLSQKYRVLATPRSYNTPMGIALTAKSLDSTHDVFIAEMGARNKGDIKEIAKMVKPSIGVITGINFQHLESFRTLDNIKNTKYELMENLAENGVGFFSSDSEGSKELFGRFNGEKYLAGENGEFVFATDIKTSGKGTEFTLNIKGEEPVKCVMVLLGSHSVRNVCLAAAVAYKIGLSPKEIALGISHVQSVGHRLELVPNNRNIVVIDDSYNANEDGINAAMDVLDNYSGRKIVLTPGLVELGKIEHVVNYEFGKKLASHANIVYVIGTHNAEMIIKGLLDGGMDRGNVKFFKTLNKANAELNGILKEGDVVLFENDLPDNYS